MKKYAFLFFMSLTLLLTACNERTENDKDKYIGVWKCTSTPSRSPFEISEKEGILYFQYTPSKYPVPLYYDSEIKTYVLKGAMGVNQLLYDDGIITISENGEKFSKI